MIELLAPVGDFECLKAAVQNGADAVYFGGNSFSARAFAKNFDDASLEKAINYAKIRGVKTNLTLNTLIKDDELEDAFYLAKKAYEYGIDAIIVQDLGLANLLIRSFPDLPIHASTQMSVHNLEGVRHLESLGFKRVVISRELSASKIEHICKHSNIEIECFIHGALCISYSGQCLFSSLIGGRSGNRGSCAQPCRLPYTLLENTTQKIDSGYLLSTRDLCGLEYLPRLVKAGVKCFKIEGRMKSPEYVATVTKIYRKYLDKILNDNSILSSDKLEIDEEDKKSLLQVFNRGGSGLGHLSNTENTSLIFKEKPNNMGLFLGKVEKFNPSKGYISLSLYEKLEIGDKICIQTKSSEENYTVSELMINNKNYKTGNIGDFIKMGRMKGNIAIGDKIYKISSKVLLDECSKTFADNYETKKMPLSCNLVLKENTHISISVFDKNGISLDLLSSIKPEKALKNSISEERISSQISKTGNTPFIFENINIDLENNLHLPSISSLNELRRNALDEYEKKLISSFKRTSNLSYNEENNLRVSYSSFKISLLLNCLNASYSYVDLKYVDRIYIPLKHWVNPNFKEILSTITNKFETYIYMPCIMGNNYLKLFKNNINKILNLYKIKGFVLSNIGQFELVKEFKNNYDLIGNYTLNLFNSETAKDLNLNTVTVSPELNKDYISNITTDKFKEIIAYGKLPLMNSHYCLLGKSNKCYKSCNKQCTSSNSYYLKDRLGFLFRIIPDNIDTITTIYNSKTTSISMDGLNCNFARIDILDESIEEMNSIVLNVINNRKVEGLQYTNGNLNKNV